MRKIAAVIFLLVMSRIGISSSAFAEDVVSTAFEKKREGKEYFGSVEIRASVGMFGDLAAWSFHFIFEGLYSDISFMAAAPLRFTSEKSYDGNRNFIRSADWDEVSDFSKIIPYISYGGNNTNYHLYAGLLAGVSIGHSTIVDRYYGVVDSDHYQGGLYLRYNGSVFGGETLLDNYLDPSWAAFRGYIRPLALLRTHNLLKRLTVGFTTAVDFLAPVNIKEDINGAVVLDRYRFPEYESDDISVVGFDLDWMPITDDLFDFTLYFDYNLIPSLGEGLHTGFMLNAEGNHGIELFSRLEYRYMSSGYLPSYFNSLYEIERITFLHRTPKLRYLLDREGRAWLHGLAFECGLSLRKSLKLTAKVEGSEGKSRNAFSFGLMLPDIYGISVSMNYIKRNFNEMFEMFNPSDSLFTTDVKLPLTRNLFIFGQFFQDFAIAESGDLRGSYVPQHSFFVGIGFGK